MFLMLNLYGEKIKVIAFAQDTMANDFRKAQVRDAEKRAGEFKDLKFIYSDANGKTSMLIYQIDEFISKKVDLIILGTNDQKAVIPAVEKALKNNIPVIILDRGIDSENYTTFINSDNVLIGKLAGEYIAKKLNGKGRVLLFEGLQTADVTHLRTKGFIDEISKYPNIKVIKRTGNYLRRDAIIEMEKVLKSGIEIDAIFSESDSMLSGIRSAMWRYGQDPSKIVMIGCDYTSEARDSIRKGFQTGSVKFPLAGKESIDIARKILRGEKVKKHIFIPVELVTEENVEAIEPIF